MFREIYRHRSLLQMAIDGLSGLAIIIHHGQSAISIIVQMVDILFWVIAFEEVLLSLLIVRPEQTKKTLGGNVAKISVCVEHPELVLFQEIQERFSECNFVNNMSLLVDQKLRQVRYGSEELSK